MLHQHELDRAEELLRHLAVARGRPIADPGGPFGHTLAAIEAYREVADALQSAPVVYSGGLEDQERVLAGLICLYALGIVRGDGTGIREDTDG